MSAKKEIHLLVKDREAAALEVCGLSVLERNTRSLRANGFVVSLCFAEQQPDPQVPLLSGDCQYTLNFADTLAKTHVILPAHDVPLLLSQQPRHGVKRLLEDSLFQDIYDKTEGWIARSLNKKASFPISRALVRTSIRPNHISVFCFVLGILGCLGFLSSRWGVRAVGAVLLQLSSILDGCDGEVARLKQLKTRLGAWLDTVFDDIIKFVMFLCLSFGYYWEFHNAALFKFCLSSCLAYLGVSFVLYHYLITHKTAHMADFRLSWQKETSMMGKNWFDCIRPILKHDFVLFLAFVLVALDLRIFLLAFLVPTWIAFFLYMASFFHTVFRRGRATTRYQS